ncbi:MAG: PPC domain-containing protein [Acidobacteriaceae bacterium]|nr:PPC domain-containing protein [Acidobacteriaceae bacterium]
MAKHLTAFLRSITALSASAMRILARRSLPLAPLLFAVLLVPSRGWALTKNCPTEPTQTTIVTNEVYTGNNCTLYTDGDVDSFKFKGTSGDTYRIVAALNGISTDICVTLYDPNLNQVGSPACTDYYYGYDSAEIDPKLTETGTYTIDITENSSAKQNYAVSLEQLFPFPSYATPIPKFGDALAGDITPLTDANLFTLYPTATTGKYEWTATLPSGASHDICMTVYFSNFTSAGCGCTDLYYGYNKIQVEYAPTKAEAGTNMALIWADGNDATATYSLEVSCVAGNCPPIIPIYPSCTLDDILSYNSSTSTLTMNFTVGSNSVATWDGWLVSGNSVESLWSQSLKKTVPPATVTKTHTKLGKPGEVGILSTLTTIQEGITCSSWETIDTDNP